MEVGVFVAVAINHRLHFAVLGYVDLAGCLTELVRAEVNSGAI